MKGHASHVVCNDSRQLPVDRRVEGENETSNSGLFGVVEMTRTQCDDNTGIIDEITTKTTISERTSAIMFVQQLAEFIPHLAGCNSSIDADQQIQGFASRLCGGNSDVLIAAIFDDHICTASLCKQASCL
jgi:hypothetical protein